MRDFNDFVASLGLAAAEYTAEQLHQLHVQVRQFAELLLSLRDAARSSDGAHSCPHDTLDAVGGDRTLVQTLTEPAVSSLDADSSGT